MKPVEQTNEESRSQLSLNISKLEWTSFFQLDDWSATAVATACFDMYVTLGVTLPSGEVEEFYASTSGSLSVDKELGMFYFDVVEQAIIFKEDIPSLGEYSELRDTKKTAVFTQLDAQSGNPLTPEAALFVFASEVQVRYLSEWIIRSLITSSTPNPVPVKFPISSYIRY